jgi:CobQ-like glutamine amidotransferase family enzyme
MTLRICTLYPDLLGTYGDGGNAMVLSRRASWRGFAVETSFVQAGEKVPVADLYCLGGGEDGPQVRAAELLRADQTLRQTLADGAVLLAVCAGFQLIGNSFAAGKDRQVEGLGLLDISTTRSSEPRAVGEVMAQVTAPSLSGLPPLSGFENHGGRTRLGPLVTPLGLVTSGVGNGFAHEEGAVSGRIVATYLHGPVLARNPLLADKLLIWALGLNELAPLDDDFHARLREERGLKA